MRRVPTQHLDALDGLWVKDLMRTRIFFFLLCGLLLLAFLIVSGTRYFRKSPTFDVKKQPSHLTSQSPKVYESHVLPNVPAGSIQEIRDLLIRAEDVYEDDPVAYQEFLKSLRVYGALAEAALQKMFFEDPSDLYLGMLCDIATPFSELFFLKAVTEYKQYLGSSKTARKVIEVLSGLKSRLLLENLSAFRVGLKLDKASTYETTIFFHMAGWGESILPYLSETVNASSEAVLDRIGASAAIGRIGNKAAADLLYDAFTKKKTLEDLRPSLIGLAHLPADLLMGIVEQHIGSNKEDARNNYLLYHAIQAKESEAAIRILTWALSSPALKDANREQALAASIFRKEPQITDVIANFVLSGQAQGRSLDKASSALSSLCGKGCGNYEKIKAVVDHLFRSTVEPRVGIRLIEAISNFSELQGDPETSLRLRSALGELPGLNESEYLLLMSAKAKLSRNSSNAALELLNLSREIENYTHFTIQSRMQSRQFILTEMAAHVNDPRIDSVISATLSSPVSSTTDAFNRAELIRTFRTRGLTQQGRDALMSFLVNQTYQPDYHSIYVHSIHILARDAPDQEGVLRSVVQRIQDPERRAALEFAFVQKD